MQLASLCWKGDWAEAERAQTVATTTGMSEIDGLEVSTCMSAGGLEDSEVPTDKLSSAGRKFLRAIQAPFELGDPDSAAFLRSIEETEESTE